MFLKQTHIIRFAVSALLVLVFIVCAIPRQTLCSTFTAAEPTVGCATEVPAATEVEKPVEKPVRPRYPRPTLPLDDFAPTEPTEVEVEPTEPPAPKTAIEVLGEKEYMILAKLLHSEANIMSWEGQVMICSAILNFCEDRNATIWDCAHIERIFAVAPLVDSAEPTQTNYDVIEYVVCGGGRNVIVLYFRTDHYHDFGTPYCVIDGVYFSGK